jgi:hypothetical protein
MSTRKPYPSDVTDKEWTFVTSYLALVREDAPRRRHGPHSLRRPALDRAHRRLVSLLAASP